MAKVYSWQISDRIPKKYAYIVHPIDINRVYIGNELTGKNLQTVMDWASNCTDNEYIEHFNELVAQCKTQGYNVEFENVETYINVSSACDNLRGPAGRGIKSFEKYNEVNGIKYYRFIYDDDTYSVFEVKDGIDGKPGTQGTPGDIGVSSKLIMLYASGENYKNTTSKLPPKPTGVTYDFISNEINIPYGSIWCKTDSEVEAPIFMTNAIVYSTDDTIVWSTPVQISGEDGPPGKDGESVEFIYMINNGRPSRPTESKNEAGFVPPGGWRPSPTGVDENNTTEWCSLRKITKNSDGLSVWGEWETPTIWAKFGERGQDGDGVQYIFLKNNGSVPHNPTPYDYENNESYQNKDEEWIPPTNKEYRPYYTTDGSYIKFEPILDSAQQTIGGVWVDDSPGSDSSYKYVWVSSRKYRTFEVTIDNTKVKKKMWGPYSNPTLWSKFGEDGKSGRPRGIRTLYTLTLNTSDVPDLPSDNIYTSNWSTGFPKDYESGENVVWCTDAEVWLDNNEFVEKYVVKSTKNKDGNIIPPSDATDDNTLEVEYLPEEGYQDENIKYLKYENVYYKWEKDTWCTPYVITGLKGADATPLDYTTYVFAFGAKNCTPPSPSGINTEFKGEIVYDENDNKVLWVDFIDVNNYGIDGTIFNEGKVIEGGEFSGQTFPVETFPRIWYQCVGKVDSFGNLVKEWGPVNPCNGLKGANGNYVEFRFGVSNNTSAPDLTRTERNPENWYTSNQDMPEIPVNGSMWQISAEIDGEDNEFVYKDKGWSQPIRISGERGPEGAQGPAGLRGVGGIPGANFQTMYCLGTYSSGETKSFWSNYHFENQSVSGLSDGYFGEEILQNFSSNPEDMVGWFSNSEIPYSDIINVFNDTELEDYSNNTKNKGRVIRYIKKNENGEVLHHTYYIIKPVPINLKEYELKNYIPLTSNLTVEESENFDIYLWCTQGVERFKRKDSEYVKINSRPNTNNIADLSEVPSYKHEDYTFIMVNGNFYEWTEYEDTVSTIEWGIPFKLQGSNGLRGLNGNRGQVVYPMGTYNPEEVYLTTKDKAPYVYDPSDGLFYVYNIVDIPWVGKLPDNYKTILKHPKDVSGNYRVVDDPTKIKDKDTKYKYLLSNTDGKYYIWDDNKSKYIAASTFKYEGVENDQDGETPSTNYANNTNDNTTPAWVRFESFEALYTSIGIIANGMVGSAVFNNEFMFSQQGIDVNDNPTNYAIESVGGYGYGFLSAYSYDEKGKANDNGVIQHWYYDHNGTKTYMNIEDVNPYEKNNNGQPLHSFRPNVCINFATGQMWLSSGKISFGQTSANIYTNDEVDEKVSDIITGNGEAIENAVSTKVNEVLDKQLSGLTSRAEMHFGPDDPSGEWQMYNSANTSTYAYDRIGDLWYNTIDKRSYTFVLLDTSGITSGNTEGKFAYGELANKFFWAASAIPDSVYNTIKTKSSVFIKKPTDSEDYKIGDIWYVESNAYSGETFYDYSHYITKGTCLVCVSNKVDGFKYTDWGKIDKYADEAAVTAAKEEMEKMDQLLTDWSSDGVISPSERKMLEDELKTIKAEYETIYNQIETYIPTSAVTYENAKNKCVSAITYHTSASGTNVTNIITGTTDNRGYGHISNYYFVRQEMLCGISDAMNNKLLAWAADGNLSPTEMKELQKDWKIIQEEYTTVVEQCNDLGITGTSAYTAFTKSYNSCKTAIEYYIGEYETNSGQPIPIVKTGDNAYSNIENYYIERENLIRNLNKALNEKIDNSNDLSEIEYLTQQLQKFGGSTEIGEGLVLSNFIGVKNNDNNITSFLNGSSGMTAFTETVGDSNKNIIFAAGIDGTNNTTQETFYRWDLYEKGFPNSGVLKLGEIKYSTKTTNESEKVYLSSEFIFTNNTYYLVVKISIGSEDPKKGIYKPIQITGSIRPPIGDLLINSGQTSGTTSGLISGITSGLTPEITPRSVMTTSLDKDDNAFAFILPYKVLDKRDYVVRIKNNDNDIPNASSLLEYEDITFNGVTGVYYYKQSFKICNDILNDVNFFGIVVDGKKFVGEIYLKGDNFDLTLLADLNNSLYINKESYADINNFYNSDGTDLYILDSLSNEQNTNIFETVSVNNPASTAHTYYLTVKQDNKEYAMFKYYDSNLNTQSIKTNKYKYAPFKVYDDGSVIAKSLKLNEGKFDGVINAIQSSFQGTINANGFFSGEIDNDIINTKLISVQSGITITNEPVVAGSNYTPLRKEIKSYSNETVNKSGHNDGQIYNEDFTLVEFDFNTGATSLEVPKITFKFNNDNSNYAKCNSDYPLFSCTVNFYKNNAKQAVYNCFYDMKEGEGSKKGICYEGNYAKKTVSKFSAETKSNTISIANNEKLKACNKVIIKGSIIYHLNTYSGMFGENRSKGIVDVSSKSSVKLNYPSDQNCFEIGSNGFKMIDNNNKTKAIISQNQMRFEIGAYGICIDKNNGLAISLSGNTDGKPTYKKVTIESSGSVYAKEDANV